LLQFPAKDLYTSCDIKSQSISKVKISGTLVLEIVYRINVMLNIIPGNSRDRISADDLVEFPELKINPVRNVGST
jgi:hypothetical protein